MTHPTATAAPATAAELGELLRSRPGRVRVVGAGTHQRRRPPAPDGALHVHVDRLAAITSIDVGDQTCVVECGVDRTTLDDALHGVGLELPCAGTGTVGGSFASDPVGALTFGGPSPRSLLLGIDALLADGTAFRCGARVVKSVAGFDVHKLLVGSDGRLFVATALCLRLHPRPRAQQWFDSGPVELPRALELLAALRRLTVPPAAVQLRRDAADGGGVRVCGRIAGRATHVATTMRTLALPPSGRAWRDHVAAGDGDAGEVLAGLALPSVVPAVVAAVPAGGELVWHGGGRFEAAFGSPAATDAALTTLHTRGVPATIVHGAPARRGRATPVDPGQQRLADGMRRNLDPDGILV